VTRAILTAALVLWLLAGLAALAVAAWGADAVEAALPPLAIDTDALRGAIVAMGAAFIGLATVHGMLVFGLARERRWAWTGATLLAALLAMLCLALGAAAATSAVATPEHAVPLVAATAVAVMGALAYAVVAAGLVGEIRRRGRV